METPNTDSTFITEELKKYNVQDAEIAKLSDKFLPLKINGLEDSDGYELVKASGIEMRTLRTTIEKKRVELKANALAYGKAVDSEARRIQELIAPIESHLVAERTGIDEERAAKELAEKLKGLLPMRLEKLATIELVVPEEELNQMDEAKFFVFFNEEQAKYLAKKEEERVAAAKQLETDRLALEEEKKELATEKERVEEIATVKEETVVQTRKIVEQEQKETTKAAEETAAAAPDIEKAEAFREQLNSLHWPVMESQTGTNIMAEVLTKITKTQQYITEKIKYL